MRGVRWVAGVTLAALLTAGLATATPAPVPPADPIGDILARPPAEEPPPVPGPTPERVQPTPAAPAIPVEPLPPEETADEAQETATAEATPPPATPSEAMPRVRRQVAILQALDKVTAETIRFEAPVGQQRRWRGLVFRVRACEVTAEDEPVRDSVAYLEITAQPRTREGRSASREVFKGWMFASSPGLNPIEHPLYDVWVISCQTREPEAPASRR